MLRAGLASGLYPRTDSKKTFSESSLSDRKNFFSTAIGGDAGGYKNQQVIPIL
jgi:hypothetical protein